MSKKLFGGSRFLGLLFLILFAATAAVAVPRVHHIYISGSTAGTTLGSNVVKNYTGMRVGQTLTVHWTYVDQDGPINAQTSTIQWFTYDDVFLTNPQPIAGATGSTFLLTAAQVGKQIAVRVTPRNAVDGTGVTREFRAFQSTDGTVTNANPVYAANGNCQRPTGAGNPVPGNQILNPSPSQCSPRNLTWQVQYTGINWQATGGLFPKIIIDWGDGVSETLDPRIFNPLTMAYDVGLFNPMLTRLDTLILTNVLQQNWRVEQPHTYDYTIAGRTVSATANERCTYTMRTTWGVGGSSCIGFSSQTQKFAVWDREDNTNLGTLDINHGAGGGFAVAGQEITDICPNDRTAVIVRDASDFNCTPGGIVENPNQNDQARWVQFVYGTTNTLATGPGATEKITIGGVDFLSSQLPVYGPVQYLPASVTTPSSVSLGVRVPTTALAGQSMQITMRTWNVCHPFDNNTLDANGLNPPQAPAINQVFNIYGPAPASIHPTTPLGGNPFFANGTPALRTYLIRVTNAPPPPTVTFTANHCDTDVAADFTFNTTHTQANSTLRWYSDAAMTDLEKSSTTSNTFNPVNEGTPAMTIPATNQERVIDYFVTEQWPGANGCLSLPRTLEFRITDTNNGGAIDHPDELAAPTGPNVIAICTGEDPPAFTNTTAASGGDGTNYAYQWQQSIVSGTASFTDINLATGLTFDPPILTQTTWYRRRVRSGYCADAFSNVFMVRVDVPVTAGSINGTQTICETDDPGVLGQAGAPTGGDGTNYAFQWEFSATVVAGPYNTVPGATASTYDPPVLTGTTHYRRRVISGECSTDGADADLNPDNTAYSNTITVTVHRINNPGSIGNGQVICSGDDPTALTSVTAASGGNGVNYAYQWQSAAAAGGPFTDINLATATTFDPGPLTSTTFYRRRVRSPGPVTTTCPETFSNVIQITVNPLPAGNVTGGGSICNPPPTPAPDMVFTFTAGTGPWDLVYSIDGIPQAMVVDTPSPYIITTPGVGVYRIVSIRDANNCTVTAPHANITTTGLASVVVGGAPPAFDTAPALGAAAVCSAGNATTDPTVGFNLNAASTVTGQDYTLSYRVDGAPAGPAVSTKVFRVDGAGAIISVNGAAATSIVFSETALNNLTPSPHVIRIIAILSPTGCQTILNQDFNFTVNPLPAGTNQTVAAACSAYTINIDPQVTSVAVGQGGNGVASTFTWTANFNGLTGMTSPGVGNIAGTLTNPFNNVRTAIFTVTPTSTATPACPGGTFTISVPVNPVPAIFDRTTTICSATAFNIAPANGNPAATTIVPAGTTYTWTIVPNANITGASNQAVAQSSIGQTLTNITNTSQTIRYVVTPRAGAGVGNCVGPTFNVDVTVDPAPVIANRTIAVCSGTAFNITPANGNPTAATIVPAGTTYSWPAPAVTGGITGGSAQTGQTSIGQTLTNPSVTPQTATYTVTPTSGASGNCVGATFTVTVTVNPIPSLSSTLTPAGICSGTFTYTPTSLTPTATFSWTRANVAGINEGASAGTGNISETLTNPTTAAVDVVYVVTTSANGCPNTGQNVTVRVNPTPIPNSVLGPANVCVGNNPFFYSVTQRPGSTYSWEIPASFTVEAAGGGTTAGGGAGPFTSDYFILLKFGVATPPAGLPIRVIEKSANGCIGLANVLTIVAANSPPTVPIAGGTSFCKFEKGVVFSVPQNASSTFTWSVNSGATIIGPSAGTNLYQIIVDFNSSPSAQIDVTETNITGCPANYPSLIVSLLDAPVITPTAQSICSGVQPSTVVDLTALTSVPSNFNWFVKSITPNITGAFQNDPGTGPLQHLPPLRNVSGTNGTIVYTVTPTAQASPFCIGLPVDITITVKPEPVVTAVANQSFCPSAFVNGAVAFPLTSNVAGATINWTSSNPAIGLAAASGTGNISFVAADNVTGADIVSTITVTANAAGCTSTGGNSKTFTITIKPRPVITTITDITVCPGDNVPVPVFASNTGGGETYAWTNDNTAIGLASSGSGNIAPYFAPANNTGSDVIGNISVVATRNLCPGPAMAFRIVIKPQPVVNTITDKTFCAGDAISIPLTSNVGGATLNWSNNNTSVGILASGTGTITGTAPANNTGADIVGTITVSATANGCVSTGSNIKTFTVTIKPTPIVDAVTNITVCSGATVPATVFTSNVISGGVTFNWTNSNTAINLAASGAGNIASFTAAVNLTGAPMVANISVIGTKNSCAGPAVPFTITVNPEPVVTAIADIEFCPGDAVNIPLTSNVVGATLNWTNSNTNIGIGTSGSGNIVYTAPANNTGANIDGNIVVTATSNSCTSAGPNTKTFRIRLKPTPIVNAITDVVVCSAAPISTIAFAANTGGSETFSWTNDNTAIGLPASGTGIIPGYSAPVNVSGAAIVANIVVTATRNSCVGPTRSFKITVNPAPVVTAITDIIVCPGDNVPVAAFASNSGGGETYAWTNDNTAIGLASSGSGNIAPYFAPANNTGVDVVGNISVVATRTGCAGPATAFRITIKPQPVVTAITDKSFCAGDAINIPLLSNVVGATINWNNNNTSIGFAASGTGNIVAVAPANNTGADIVGTITVSATANGCVSTGGNVKTFNVTIKPTPIVDPVTNITVCSGANVPVTAFTSNVTSGGVTFSWTNSNTAINLAASGTGNIAAFTAAVNTSGVAMVANISVVGTKNGCAGPPVPFTITVNPEPVVAAITDIEFCPGDAVNIPLTSNVAGATINWSNSNTNIGIATSGTGNIVYTAPANNTGANVDGIIVVTATANGCLSTGANTKSFRIRIKPTPIVNTITDVVVCSGTSIATIPFSANTGGGETFSWTNDNTSIGLPASGSGNIPGYIAPVNVGGAPIVANIVVSATRNSCAGPTRTFKITVNPEPVVAALTNVLACPTDGINVALTSNVPGATLTWTNSNTLIGLSGSGTGDISFVASANTTGSDIVGTITVTATANGCSSTGANVKTFTITVHPSPVVNAVSNIVVCSAGSVNVPNFGSNVAGGGVTFNWTNDTPSIGLPASGTGNIGTFTAAANITSSPIVATISVTGTKNGCTSVTPRTFTITLQPEPVGTSDAIAICSDAAVGVNLSTMITGGAAAARFNITITNSAGLSASAGAPADGTNLLATEIQNDKWTNHTGAPHDIVYNITPISGGTPACPGTPFTLTVTINPEPVVTTVANQLFCPGDAINIALSSNVAGANMSWTNSNPGIGLGFTGTGDITYVAPANNTGSNIVGTITVMAESNGCTSSGTNIKTFTITIKPTPIVNTVTDIVVCSGANIAAINFAANTGGSETFNWTNDNTAIGLPAAGAGNIAAFAAPVNISGAQMIANIGVTATKNSCSGPVMAFRIIVNPEPVVAAITNASFCQGEAVNIPFTSNVPGATISWTNTNTSIGLGTSGGGNIVYVAPANTSGADIVGTITVIASMNGCVSAGANAKSFTITIKPSPVVNFQADITVCSGATIPAINFGSNVGSGGVTFNWTNNNTAIGLPASGSGNIASFPSALNLTSSPIKATITVIGSKNGCDGPARNFDITILPQPVGNPVPVTVCSDAAVAVNLNSVVAGAAATFNITITNAASLPASAGSPANVNGVFASEIQDDRWTNITGTAQTIVYHVTPIGPGSPGCVGNTFDLPVTINPEPVVAAITNQEFCPATAINIPLTSNVVGATISWTNSNPLIGLGTSGSGNIGYTTPANNTGSDIVGTITVSASMNGCVSSGANIKTFDIKIKPTPIVNTLPNVIVCSGAPIATINFTANTAGGETFNWTNSNAAVGLPLSSSGNIPGYTAPVNLTGAPIVATITVTATRNSCVGPPMNFSITVNPEPVVTAIVNQAFCAGESVNIPLASNVPGAAISWTNSNSSIGLALSGSGNIVYTAPTNNTGSDIVGTIVVSASKDGCLSAGANTKTFTITIKPTPVVTPMTDIVVCSGQNVIVPAFGSNVVSGGVTFNWSNDNTFINLAATGTGNIASFTAATNISGAPMIANMSVTGTKNSCTSLPVTFRIIINPEPVVTAITDAEFCPGQLVNIPLFSNVPGALIKWTNSNTSIGIPASGNGDIVYTAPANNTGADFVATLTVTGELNSCISTGANLKTFQITIKATPVVNAIPSIEVCSGDPISAINFASNADPGVTFNWTNDNTAINLGANGTGNIPAFVASINTGSIPLVANISVTGTKNGCTGAIALFKITVRPEPVIAVAPPPDVCSGAITNITLSTNGSSVNAVSYRIDQIEYSSNGGPFGTVAPAAFTPDPANKTVTSSGGTTHINGDKFTNLSPFFVTVRYTVTPISPSSPATPAGCDGAAAQISIRVLPEPDLDNALNPAAICSGETVVSANPTFLLRSDPSSVAATSFIIRSISAPGLVAGPSNAGTGNNKPANAINNDSWINTSNAPVNVEYVIAPVTAGCVGKDETITVVVNPSPAVKDGLDRIVCNDAITNIVLQDNSPTSVNADRFDIMSITVGGLPIAPGSTVGGLTANAGNSVTGITTNVNAIRNDRFVNTTTDRIVVSYAVVAISPAAVNSCRGPVKIITVTVEPQIVSATVNTTPVICSGDAISLTFASPTYANGAPTNPTVTFSYSTLPATISGTTVGNNLAEGHVITDVLVNNTNAPVIVTYRITPRAAAAASGIGCAGTFEDVTVRVEPRPRINPIATKNVCESTPVNLNLVSNTTPTTGSIKIFVTATPEDASVAGFSNNVLVNNNTMLADNLTNSASVTKYVTYHFEVRNVDATDATICTAGSTIDVVVGVIPTPVISPIANFAICSGEAFTPIAINTDTEFAGESTNVSWTVVPNANVSGESNGAGNTFTQVLFNNTSDKQVVSYNINARNVSNVPQCASPAMNLLVTVYPVPKLVGLPNSVNVCNNSGLTPNPYVLTPSTVPALGTTFDWTIDNGSNPDMPVLASATNQTQINQIFVNNGTSLGTQQYSITAHLTMAPGDNPLIDVPAGIDNVCTAQSDGIMVVNVAPQVSGDLYGFDIDGNQTDDVYLCRGAKTSIFFDPIGLPLLEVEYTENGVTKTLTKLAGLKNLQISPTVNTTYELISVKDKFNCVQPINKVINVTVDEVDNNFNIVGPAINCSPFQATFEYNQVTGTSYTWRFADGPDSTTYLATTSGNVQVKHTYTNSSPSQVAPFTVSLDAFLDETKFLAGCRKRDVQRIVRVYPIVTPGVFPNKDAMCSDETVTFTNNTIGSTLQHRWFYRVQGTTAELDVRTTPTAAFQIPNTTATNPLIYEVVYQSTNGNCPAADVVTPITVYRGIDAHFSHTVPTLFQPLSSTMTVTNDSQPVDGGDFRYEWNFGRDAAPATATDPGPTFNLTYTSPGPKQLVLTVTNIAAEAASLTCVDEFSELINILIPPLIVDFDVDPMVDCYPTDVTVVRNESSGNKQEWRVFDAGGTVAESNVAFPKFKIPAPGKYTVELTVSNTFTGDEKVGTKEVLIYDLPIAEFVLRPPTVYVPDTEVETHNLSEGALTYLWDFDDGSPLKSEAEPKHTYRLENVYNVMLVAIHDHGDGAVCTDTLVRKVTAKQGGVTRVPNAFTPNPDGPGGGSSDPFDNKNDVFLPQVRGAEEFNMQIFDRWGNLIFESNKSTDGWDGYDKNGKLMPAGVYVYKLTLRLSDGQRTTQVGDITMIR